MVVLTNHGEKEHIFSPTIEVFRITLSFMTSLIRLPTLYLSHGGGPMHALDNTGRMFSAIDKNSKSADFLRSLPQRIAEYSPISAIKAIVIISGHWEESEFTVGYQSSGTSLIYDYYGFDREAYAPYLTYPVPTDLAVADRVFGLLQQAGIPARKMNRGFDHGTFMPLLLAFPEAKIPVVQVSMKAGLDPTEHFRLGEILQPLREEGILIIGSGSLTHNRQLFDISGKKDRRAAKFTESIYQELTSIHTQEDYEALIRALSSSVEANKKFPYLSLMHPTMDHFTPLLVAVGAGVTASSRTQVVRSHRLYSEIACAALSLDTYLFE